MYNKSCISVNNIIPEVFAIEFKPNCLSIEFFESISFWVAFKFSVDEVKPPNKFVFAFFGEPMQYRELFKQTMIMYNNGQRKVLNVKRSILYWSKINLVLLLILLLG